MPAVVTVVVATLVVITMVVATMVVITMVVVTMVVVTMVVTTMVVVRSSAGSFRRRRRLRFPLFGGALLRLFRYLRRRFICRSTANAQAGDHHQGGE